MVGISGGGGLLSSRIQRRTKAEDRHCPGLEREPALIICDEPVSALDVSIQSQIINLLKELQNSLDLSYLFISHDLNVVGYISDTVAVMYLGHIMEYAPADELYEHHLNPYTVALFSAIPSADPA